MIKQFFKLEGFGVTFVLMRFVILAGLLTVFSVFNFIDYIYNGYYVFLFITKEIWNPYITVENSNNLVIVISFILTYKLVIGMLFKRDIQAS